MDSGMSAGCGKRRRRKFVPSVEKQSFQRDRRLIRRVPDLPEIGNVTLSEIGGA